MLDDSINGGEAKAGSLVLGFGGEERLEDVACDVGRNSRAVVTDREHDVGAGLDIEMESCVLIAEFDVGGFEGELASVGHGVPRVDDEV